MYLKKQCLQQCNVCQVHAAEGHWPGAKISMKHLTSWILHLNAVIHLCIVKQSFFCLKIWSARHSKTHTHSNKSLHCFPFAFPYSYCFFIVKYTVHHKCSTEPITVTYTGGVGWTAAVKPLPALWTCMHYISGLGHRRLQKSRPPQILQPDTPVFGAQCTTLLLYPNPSNEEVWKSGLSPIIYWKVRFLVA